MTSYTQQYCDKNYSIILNKNQTKKQKTEYLHLNEKNFKQKPLISL